MSKAQRNQTTEAATIAETEVGLGELSELFGVSIRTLQRLSQVGVLEAVATRGKSGKKYYNLASSVRAYIQKLRDDFNSELHKKDMEDLKSAKLEAEVALKKSQGELHKLKTEIAKGEYISVEDVQLEYEKFFVIFKKFATAIPSRVGGQIAGYVDPITERGIEKELQTEINQMLRSFVVAGYCAEDGVKR